MRGKHCPDVELTVFGGKTKYKFILVLAETGYYLHAGKYGLQLGRQLLDEIVILMHLYFDLQAIIGQMYKIR